MTSDFLTLATHFGRKVSLHIQQHPRRITMAIAALSLTSAGAAFAIASLSPDSARLPVHQIVQPLDVLASMASKNSQTPALRLYRSETVRASDSADTLLTRLGISDPAAAAFLRRNTLAHQGIWGRTGRIVSAEATDTHELLKLTVRWASDNTNFQRLVIEKTENQNPIHAALETDSTAAAEPIFTARLESAPLAVSTRLASGIIESSLFAATDDAKVPDSIAVQVAELFSADIDFRRSLRKNDRFSVVYETLEADGEPLRAGRVLSAEFVNKGKTFDAVWFEDESNKGRYYTLDGKSRDSAYLTSPLKFSRVTSGFKMRMHPILKKWRAHLGTDYGAPTGTPVRTVADGMVEFAGVQNGFGNVIYVKHRNKSNVTVYAHLSKIYVKKSDSVSQGQDIGAVGATGWATGPHLHFEFRVNGEHKDPLSVIKQNDEPTLSVAENKNFQQLQTSMRMQLDAASSTQLASAQ